MTWLVTGGAGYIGAHVVRSFAAAGLPVAVIDDLSSGHAEFVPADVPLVRGSVLDAGLVAAAIAEHAVRGVVHLAGYKYAGVSVQRPLHTYAQNVEGTRVLLEAMGEAAVDLLVFSSSAAVYGTPDVDLVTEGTPTGPESPYGETKLIGEWLIRDLTRVTALRATSLRYFNVVGSSSDEVYDSSPHNLFPLVLKALTEGVLPRINGVDYATPDGTCVRDYVHVGDVARRPRRGRAGPRGRHRAGAGLQPRQRRRGVRAPDHGRGRARHRPAVRPGRRRPPAGRPGPHRGLRRAGPPRPRLADDGLAGRHGGQRLARLDRHAGPRLTAYAGTSRTGRRSTSAASMASSSAASLA